MPLLITNVTTIPTLPTTITNNTNQTIIVNFSSNYFPINITFHLYNNTDLVNTQGPITVNNISGLPVTYLIPGNLSDGTYYLNMTVVNSYGSNVTIYLGSFTITTPCTNCTNPQNNTTQHTSDPDRLENLHLSINSDRGNNFTQVLTSGNQASNHTIILNSRDKSCNFLYLLIIAIIVVLIIIVVVILSRR